MNPLADLLGAYVGAVWAAVIYFGLLCALTALAIAGLAWVILRGSRRREPAATSENLPVDTPADQRPGPIDETYLRLEAAYRQPAAARRNTH